MYKWQQIGNRKSASQNNIYNRNKITAKRYKTEINIFSNIFGFAEVE